MFVIPRKEGESIVIGDEIVVKVAEIQGEQVRLTVERLSDGTDNNAEATEVVLREQQARTRPR
jgi:carbon storage regulator CsrA